MQEEEKRKLQITKEINRFQNQILLSANEISELESEQKIINIRSQNEKKKVETLRICRAKVEKMLSVKKNDLYNIELEAQKCEIRLQRLTDVKKDKDELYKKQKMLQDLQKVNTEKTDVFKLLQTQIDHIEVS